MRMRSFAATLFVLGGVWASNLPTTAARWADADEPATTSSMRDDPVATLNAGLQAGQAALKLGGREGYLLSVLDRLNVPLESQVVTFSQASLHGSVISDMYPRAIYFNEDVAVAWAPGAPTIEVVAHSPRRGLVFYSLDQSADTTPLFKEESRCLTCHKSARTLDVPGLMVLSTPIGSSTPVVTDHRSPLRERWGSWYVTGLSRRWKHEGNRIGQGWLESLHDQFELEGYPTLHSDIVALMVLEHQTRLTNLITRARTLHASRGMTSETLAAIDELADYMLFVDEAPLPERIIGTSGYTQWFSARGPKDEKGRSLYQLDLKHRLFAYPLSYMIYSAVFDSLPGEVKTSVYARVNALLEAPPRGERYPHLTATSRKAVLEMLEATKPDFAVYRKTLG